MPWPFVHWVNRGRRFDTNCARDVGAAAQEVLFELQEVGLLQDDWGKQKVPLCISHEGLFLHSEIDG